MSTGIDLELIPRRVRDKLDRVGIKMHLREWQLMSLEERQRLCDLDCEADPEILQYRAEVNRLVLLHCGKAADVIGNNP